MFKRDTLGATILYWIGAAMFIVALVAAWYGAAHAGLSRNTDHRAYIDYAHQITDELGLPKDLLAGICQVESSWQPLLVGAKDEIGLCQMRPRTLAMFTHDDPKELYDPYYAIYYAGMYLKWLSKTLGTRDPDVLAAAYNGGPNNPTVRYMMKVRRGW